MVNTISTIQQFWSDGAVVRMTAGQSGTIDLVEKLAWQDVLRRHLNAGRRKIHVLDVGTGAGLMPILLHDLRHKTTGVDISAPLLAIAQQRCEEADVKADFVQVSAENIDFPDATFDAVIVKETLELLAQPAQAIQAWLKALKPGGRIIAISDHRESAEVKRQASLHAAAQLAGVRSSIAKSYLKQLTHMPLWQADSAEISAFFKINGLENVTKHTLAGQLTRSGKWRFQSYEIGYSLVVGEKGGSIPLKTR